MSKRLIIGSGKQKSYNISYAADQAPDVDKEEANLGVIREVLWECYSKGRTLKLGNCRIFKTLPR